MIKGFSINKEVEIGKKIRVCSGRIQSVAQRLVCDSVRWRSVEVPTADLEDEKERKKSKTSLFAVTYKPQPAMRTSFLSRQEVRPSGTLLDPN